MTRSQNPDVIRREIERTQSTLSHDVDALSEKVSPGRTVERQAHRARDRMRGWKDAVMGSDAAHDGAAHRLNERASGAASAVGESVGESMSDAAEAAAQAPQVARSQTRGNPVAAGLIAFGAGWLVSSLLPSGRRERELVEQAQEWARPAAQALGEKAGQIAGEVRENMATPVQEAVESVRDTATGAGRSVAEEGQAAAGQVRDQAKESAGAVRESGR